eukprot:TRINITY_DN1266_c0_g1_i6.p5 TRINITY_DN1266_c0_g1~~TRINITY_DN1266_c0_g1_i6.p5  ORF type:complete len:265 (+),score=-17.86 TRINITY_DN1266_c0_g1_i6:1844-2638(+)
MYQNIFITQFMLKCQNNFYLNYNFPDGDFTYNQLFQIGFFSQQLVFLWLRKYQIYYKQINFVFIYQFGWKLFYFFLQFTKIVSRKKQLLQYILLYKYLLKQNYVYVYIFQIRTKHQIKYQRCKNQILCYSDKQIKIFLLKQLSHQFRSLYQEEYFQQLFKGYIGNQIIFQLQVLNYNILNYQLQITQYIIIHNKYTDYLGAQSQVNYYINKQVYLHTKKKHFQIMFKIIIMAACCKVKYEMHFIVLKTFYASSAQDRRSKNQSN